MARKRMVTRGIEVTRGTALALVVETKETAQFVFEVSGKFKTEESLLKALQKVYADQEARPIAVLESYVDTILYGLDEQEFLKMAVQLDAKTRKPIAQEPQVDDNNG